MKKLTPIEVPWKPLDALVVFAVTWIGLPIVLVLVVRALMPYVPEFGQFITALRQNNLTASFIFAVADAVAAFGLLSLYLRHYKARWRDLGWHKFNIVKTVLYIVGGMVLFVLAVQVAFIIVHLLFPAFNATQTQANEFSNPQGSTGRTMSLIALVILPPIVEETVFRGFIFPALSQLGGVFLGAILTSILFGLAHLQYNVSVYTLILSLILCFMYYRLRSIWPGVLLHMLNNYIAYMVIIKK